MESTLLMENRLMEVSSFPDVDKPSVKQDYIEIIKTRIDYYKKMVREQSEEDIDSKGIKNYSINSLQDKGFNLKFPNITKISTNTNYSISLQKWIGHVIDIGEFTFTAKINEINIWNSTYETAEFSKLDISNEDLKLLKIGAIFYWNIGYSNEYGQRKKESLLLFQRRRELSTEDFEHAMDQVDSLLENLIIS